MSRQGGIGFLGNSVANLVVGAAALGYAVIVPAVVVRRFGTDLYGTWYLAFQVAAYVLLLDLGSQWVVTKVASTLSRDAGAARLTTAAMVAQAGLAVGVVGVATAWAAFTGQDDLTRLVLILGAAAASSLLASTVRAWFVGLQQAHLPALWLVGARLGAVAGLGLALAAGSGLVTLTLAVALPQVVVNAGLLLWSRRRPSPWARPDRDAFARLYRSSLPLALWTLCGVIVASVDIFVVRAVDPSEVGRYAIALPLLAIPIGVVTAAMSAWMPRLAVAEAAAPEGGREPALAGTAVMTAALAVGAIVFVAFAGDVVRLWAGEEGSGSAATYLRLL
jgi:O-antigen/teichoic acid export membrane protein